MPTDYYTAQARILEYANHCSYTGMKALLNESIDAAVNQRRPDDIIESAVRFQTQQERQERLVAQRRAEEAEATLAAQQRERQLREQIEAGEDQADEPPAGDQAQQTESPSQPPAAQTPQQPT